MGTYAADRSRPPYPVPRGRVPIALFGILAALTVAHPARGQESVEGVPPDTTGAIIGHVREDSTGLPIAMAEVTLPELGLGTVTNAAGRFDLLGVTGGTHTIRIRHITYGIRELTVTLEPGRDVTVQVTLSPEAVELAPLEVTVRRVDPDLVGTGFYVRKMSGNGGIFHGEEYTQGAARSWKPIPKPPDPRDAPPGACVRPVLLNARPYRAGYVRDYYRHLAGIEIYGPSTLPPDLMESLAAYRRVTRDLPRHPAEGRGEEVERMLMNILRCGVVLMWSARKR